MSLASRFKVKQILKGEPFDFNTAFIRDRYRRFHKFEWPLLPTSRTKSSIEEKIAHLCRVHC